jgi:hypothetical protein
MAHRVYGQNLQSKICECRNEEELQAIMARIIKAHGEGLISEGTMRKLHKRALKVRENLRASGLILPPSSPIIPVRRGGLYIA